MPCRNFFVDDLLDDDAALAAFEGAFVAEIVAVSVFFAAADLVAADDDAVLAADLAAVDDDVDFAAEPLDLLADGNKTLLLAGATHSCPLAFALVLLLPDLFCLLFEDVSFERDFLSFLGSWK